MALIVLNGQIVSSERFNPYHDQLGRFASADAWSPGNWTEVGMSELRAEVYAKELDALHATRDRSGEPDAPWWAEDQIQRTARATAEAQIPDGTYEMRNGNFTITVRNTQNRLSINQMQADLDSAIEANPLPHGLKISLEPRTRGSAYAATDLTGQFVLVYSGWHNTAVPPGYFMPASATAGTQRWVVTHEYGHALSGQTYDQARLESAFQRNHEHLNEYGRSNRDEAYAEAFAEFHLSAGLTENPAALDYAREFGWQTQPLY